MVTELPNGNLFAVWYHGSGERTADDVIVEFSRRTKDGKWTPRQTIADTPGFPDCNPTVFVDSKQRLWLLWPIIIANEWHTALMQYKISSDYNGAMPRWEVSEPLLFKPKNFAEKSLAAIQEMRPMAEGNVRFTKTLDEVEKRAKDKYFSRMGWMTRAHPVELQSGRILVPLYSDGYSYSIIAYTDDGGRTWSGSEPIVGVGSIQPSIVRKRDGTLVAYMRDNGPPPKRIMMSESADNGVTWSKVVDTSLPNPGAGAEAINLKDGRWALIYNDLEKGRNSLAVSISDDEGKTWKWTRHLEKEETGSFHYPSLIQTRDGKFHATYSTFISAGKTIRHAAFDVDWVTAK